MKFNKRILSFILAFAMMLSHLTPVLAKTSIENEKNVTKAQEIQIGDNVYYIFSKDKNAKGDLIKSQEKNEKKTEAIQRSDGLDISDNLFGRPVGAGRPASYTLNIKGTNFKGVGGKTFDWATLPEGLELQVFYIDEEGFDYNVGNPITINESNYQEVITRTFDIAGQPYAFGMKTNVDTETYLTDAYLTNEKAPDPWAASLNMTFDLVQVPSTKVDVKWVDVNQQPLARENTPATSLKDILTFNFIEGKKFDLPNQDKVDSYFRLNNKIGREEVKDIKGATALVDGKKDGEEVTLDGKTYKLGISYSPAYNIGSKITLIYMSTADKITAANLKAVDTTALQGQDFPEKFWNDGVALADNVDAAKKTEYEALLKDATVTDITNPARTTAEAGDKVGTLLVTFKDGSKLEVQNQKLIVKPNTVTVAFDKAQGKEHPLRDGDTTVKGKITASSNSDKFPVSLDGAVVTIKKGDTVLTRTLANADGSFVAGVKDPLIAGEDISVVVTLPESKTASAPVTEKVQLNPDKLNSIIPTGKEVFKHFDGKKGVNQDLVKALKAALDEADKLVDDKGKVKSTVKVSSTGQKSLDDQYEAIKKAIEALTGNSAPKIGGTTSHKEIFKGDALNLEDGIKVTDADGETDIDLQGGKKFTYKVEKIESDKRTEITKENIAKINETPGTYEVVYTAKDKSGAKGTFTMTLVVKDIVYTKIAVTTDPTTTKYLVKDKDTKATVDYTGTVVTLTKNNGETEEATYDKATGKFKIGEKAIDELTIAPKEVAVADSPAVVTATYKAGNTKLTANAGKNIIVQIDSDGNGKADSEENFDITKAKSMEVTNQPTLNYELDYKTGKATLDLKPLVVKVTDSLGNFKYFGYDEIKSDNKFALALGTDAFDKTTAKELTTADNDKKVKVTLTYKAKTETEAAKTLNAETSAIKVEDNRPNVIENPTPGEKREGYVTVLFNAGKNGGLKGVNTFLVKKDTASSEVKVPKIVPAAGYKVKAANGGWDKAIPAKFTEDFTATAQYEEDVATSETPKDGYTPITFDALDKGKIGDARTKTIYVNPAMEIKLADQAPQVTANTGYSFKAWDPAIDTAKKYTKEERILATYNSDELISDKEKAGYIKVTFDQGKHGKFNVTDPAQKTDYWVKPGTIVDLREKAPKLTADAGYIHTGWSQDLVVNFKADAGDQTITAQYGLDSDYSTTEKAGYTKITFDKGSNGEFAKDAKTELWVNPAKELTLPAPGIVPHPGYSHTGWTKDNAAVELNTPAKYTKATTITAAYESDISETKKDGFVKVSFDAGKNGTIADNVKKDFWVNPNKKVDLTDKAPAVTPKSGYLFIKWDHKLVDTFNKATTIKATYASAGDIKTEQTDGFTKVTFDAGENGKFAEGTQVTYWVNPAKELVLPEPRVIPNKGFEHTGWDPALTPAKKYEQETTIKATYKQEISTTEVDGHQEIKFLAGDDGTFADGKKEISIWVKPDTLVDLRKSAPEVTVTTEGKTFTGWDKDLVGSFAKSDQATVIKAKYAGSTSETPVPGWTEITFKSGEHGNFGTLNKTPIVEKKLWVDPKADVKLSDKAPKTIDDKNWSFDKWMDGENAATELDVAGKYTEAKTYTASYKSDISTTPQEGFVKVTFAPGTDGTFDQGATTETYVRANKEVDIKDKAPKVTPKSGLSHKGWAIDNAPADLTKIKVSTDTTITAQYTKAVSDKPVEGWTRLQFNSGDHGRFVQDAITVKWVDPEVKLTLKEIAPGITPDKNYRLSAWNDGSADVDLETEKLFAAPATFTAKYEKISSDSEIPGFTKITFKSGEHGNFGTKENSPVTVKDIWVNPKSEVKLSEIAPELVIETNWSFDKWMDGQAAADMNTAQTYTAEKTLTATYESDFSDVAKEGFVKVEFLAGDHGKFEQVNGQDQVTTIYVRKDKEIDITVKEPKVTPDNGYYFTGWDKPLQKVYTADTTHTGKNEKAIATEAVDGWTQITFNAGDKGLFKPDAKTVIWVKPNTKVALKDQVPGLEIQKGYSCIGWKKDAETNITDLTVPATYDKSTTFTAAYESDFSKGQKDGFIEIKFEAGANGNFGKTTGTSSTEVKDYSLWVRPDKEVDLTDQAPEVTPHVGWKANGWDKEITKVTVNAQTVEANRTFTAQYLKDDDVSDTKKEGYIEITFNAGDHGTFPNDAKTVKYVNPDSEIALSTIAPTVNPAINYSFKAWNNGTADVALDAKIKYTQTTNYKATYESDISDTAKEGFVEVKFAAGTDGEFKQVNGVDQKTTFYVKKDKLVDLTDVAPTVTGKDKKTFTGWDSDLKRTFTDATTTINAKYTESISDKYVKGWTEITFMAGEHGNFGKDGTTPVVVKKLWVDPKAQVALNEKAPKVTPYTNWLFDKWMDGSEEAKLSTPAMYTDKKTFTANYKSVFSDKKEDDNVLITFKPGDNGRFANGAKTTTYVAKGVEVDLTEKAPVVIPNQNYGHKGWDPALKGTFTQSTDITAQYEKGTFKADELTSIDVFGPTKLSYAEGQQLDLAGLKIVVKDKAGIQETYVGAKAITDAGFTITPANETALTIKDHDKQPIMVSKEITVGQDKKTIEGKTVSTLSVSMNKSADPTDVLARNLGKDPQKTTVTGKAPEGSIIKVTDIDGKDLTDGTEIKADSKGEFTITLKDKLAPGTPVKVTSTEPGKTESSPVVKQVFEDINSDGTDDEKQKSAMPTDVKAMNQNKVENGKVTDKAKTTTTVTGKAKADAEIKIYNVNGDDITPAGGVKADPTTGEFTAEVTRQADNAVIKVTAKEADKALPSDPALASVIKDADNDGIADLYETTTITSVIARNIGTGDTTPKKAATFTTIEGVAEPGSKVTIKFQNKGQEVVKTVDANADTGAYKLELNNPAILLDADTVVKAQAKYGNKKPSGEIKTKVFDDLDADGKADDPTANKTERPSALAYNFKDEAKTTIKGEAEPGAKVIAKVGNIEVGNATANSDGNYEISATKDGAKLPKGTKVSVTATLAPKGTSPAQETVVYDDLDGDNQPDTSQAFDKDKIRGLEVVASPNKTVYNNKEHLNLAGMKVLLTDQMGNKKIVEFAKFEEYGIKVSPLNNIELSDKDVADGGNNGQKIKAEVKVAVGNSEITYPGETPTALEVNKDQTAKPTDVTAANQGADSVTKVRFKAAKGAIIKIYKADDTNKANLIDGTPVAGTDKDAGYLIATLKEKLPEGTLIEITAQETGKKESSPEQARVIRDKNSNWEGGKTIKLSTPVISQIREKDKNVTINAPKAEDKIKTIEVTDGAKTVTLVKDTAAKTWKVKDSKPEVKVTEKDGKIEIPVDGKLTLKAGELIKVTFKDGEDPANEAFDKTVVKKASQKPIVDPVYTGEKEVKIVDPTLADETATTIKVKVNENDSLTIEKQADNTWKIKEKPSTKVEVEDGKIVVPLDPKAAKGDKIIVTTINDSKVESDPTEVEVVDKVLTKKPEIKEATKDTNFVTGTAEKNADIVVKVTKKDGTSSEFRGKADGDGNFKVTTDKLVDGDKVVATASEPGKADNTSDEKIVGVDTSKLKESIDKADPIAGEKDKDTGKYKNLDENKPIDKELKEALDKAKDVKDKGDKNDSTIDQGKVDDAKKELDKAIAQKEADKAVDKAKDNPTPENIKDAQDKIDAIPGSKDPKADDYNPIKKELQDKLDLIKIIKEAEEETKKDGYKDKPGKDRRELEKAIKEGKENLKNNTKITESTTKIEKALEKIRKETLKVSINDPKVGDQSITIRTYPSLCDVEVFINKVSMGKIKTNGFGTYSFTLDEPINSGTTIELKAHKDGYNDNSYWTKVK
ncbi:Ig-like domain-containing protein [Lagierella sp. ICN-221743]